MKSLVDGIGTLTKGRLVVKSEVGEDIWDLDISRWGDVDIMGVEGKLTEGEFGMMNANEETFFSLIIPSILV